MDLDAWADALEAHLRAIDASVGSNRVVDTAKVAEIKKAIAGGRFRIDLDAVADGLLRALRDLMRAPKE